MQFLSYEGTLEAADGPASGVQSIEIGARETSSTEAGQSLQLSGTGRRYTDFSWQDNQPQTFGQINVQQSFGSEGTPPASRPIATSCPSQIDAVVGTAAQAQIHAVDPDGMIAAITTIEQSTPGITLSDIQLPATQGTQAEATIAIADTVAGGLHRLTITFRNSDTPSQVVVCTVRIQVQGTPPPPPPPSVAATRIRIMAANITSGTRQSYDPGHGIRIFQGFKPDIILIQEFNYKSNSPADIAEFVRETFGPDFQHFRESGAQIPNGVISRWPIQDAGKWEDSEAPNREFVYARIDIPGPVDLWAISLHLLTRNATTRNSEATELLGRIRDEIPVGDYLVIGGDFNTDNTNEPALGTLDEVADLTQQPADREGSIGTNASRRKPYDWVLPDDDLARFHVPVEIGELAFPSGLVFDSRVFEPLSLVAPVQRGDSGAENMQHMAVIKDFRVPAN